MNDIINRDTQYIYSDGASVLQMGNASSEVKFSLDFSFSPPITMKWDGDLYFDSSNYDTESKRIANKQCDEYIKNNVATYKKDILSIIESDEYIDGEVSNSERYMYLELNDSSKPFILMALNEIYADHFGNAHYLIGVLTMLSSVSYEAIRPQGVTMVLALLNHIDLEVRDKAIQAFEKWNSKKGIVFLKNLQCEPQWLQKYVEKVIFYLERYGLE